jgi:putative NADH-flavin reductase
MPERYRRIALFGATGRTGRHLVEQALERGHEVAAFVRDAGKLQRQHDRLDVVIGDVHNLEDVKRAVQGVDAVFSVLGWVKGGPKDVLRTAAEHYVEAMKEHGVRRIVTLLGAGTPDPRDPSSAGRRFMLGLMKLVVREMVEDAVTHADRIRASGLEYTIVRPPRLTDGDRTGDYRFGYMALGPVATISRADLATAMLDALEEEKLVGEAPMVVEA